MQVGAIFRQGGAAGTEADRERAGVGLNGANSGAAVQAGGDRQIVHEVVREESHAVTAKVKAGTGTTAELLDRLRDRAAFQKIDFEMYANQSPREFVGRSPEQVTEFIAEHVAPVRARYAAALGMKAELSV